MQKFPLGRLVSTPAAANHLENNLMSPISLIQRHVTGDYGVVDADDARANESAIKHGARVLSAYVVNGVKLYVITEADRSSTTVLLADEY